MTAEHQLLREDVMADVDGQLPEPRRAFVRAHVESCAECRALVDDLHALSGEIALEGIEPAPPTLGDRARALAGTRRLWSRSRTTVLVTAAAGVVLAALVITPRMFSNSPRPGGGGQALREALANADFPLASPSRLGRGGRGGAQTDFAMSGQPGQQLQRRVVTNSQYDVEVKGPLIERTASLSITVERFDGARETVESIARSHDGRIGQIAITSEPPAPRTLRATLRIPPARLDAALSALRQLGRVTHEAAASEDVTDSVRDLRVRIANGRREEQRLVELVARRTGDLKDVLEVERALARVRTEVEQMEAEDRAAIGRVDFAAVTLEIEERYRAELAASDTPLGARLRNALVDGIRAAGGNVAAVAATFLQLAPTLIVWLVLLALPARAIWRRVTAR
jgi:hypothetical protein